MDASSNPSLLSFLSAIPDPRSPHGRQHSLSAVLGLVCCAVMCGARGYSAIGQWASDQDISFMHRLGFTRRPPKSGGIRKVLIALSRTALEDALTQWAEALLGRPLQADEAPPKACALDGKTARGSFDGLNKAVHLLSLLAHESGLTVAQTEVPHGGVDKTNEHKTALRLLQGLVLEGRLITGDAIFCQRDLSRQVLDAKGHYLWFVKENQPTLLREGERHESWWKTHHPSTMYLNCHNPNRASGFGLMRRHAFVASAAGERAFQGHDRVDARSWKYDGPLVFQQNSRS